MLKRLSNLVKKMSNKIGVFNTSQSYGFKDQNSNTNVNNNNSKTTDPIPQSQVINVESYLKMFLLFTSDMKVMFSGI